MIAPGRRRQHRCWRSNGRSATPPPPRCCAGRPPVLPAPAGGWRGIRCTRLLDSAFIASIAAGGGAPWNDAGDPEQGRRFWSWWLDRAAEAGE
ncbi:MAG: Imm5 family immunity protein [Solirubrobacteraceae bacterium]